MIVRICIAAVLCCGLVKAQSLSPASSPQPVAPGFAADELVDQLVANAAALRATLPSMTAHETVETHASRGILWQNTRGEGTVRVLRKSGGLKETHEMSTFNGKPVAPSQQKGVLQLSDGFIGPQDMFFTRRERPCFSFTLLPKPTKDEQLRLGIVLSPQYASLSTCIRGLEGLVGFGNVDRVTHQLTHLERTIPTQVGARAPFAAADYAPANIGGKTFWLPSVTVASTVLNKANMRTTVRYSDYHQFTASSTIVPTSSE